MYLIDHNVPDSPSLISTVPEYLNQVDLEEERENQELIATQELAGGAAEARSIPLLLEKLSVPGQVPFYYCGGFAILSEAITNCESSYVCCSNSTPIQFTVPFLPFPTFARISF